MTQAEIIYDRKRERKLRRELRRKATAKVLDKECYTVSGDRLRRTQKAI